jgi:hypothetical protein
VPYLFERDGTNCENLPETHGFLKALRKHVEEKFANRMLLSEANQWPEDAVAYFGAGDESHMAFHSASPSSTSWPRRRPSRTPASGPSSCATTTS